jgi:hypothetical protein
MVAVAQDFGGPVAETAPDPDPDPAPEPAPEAEADEDDGGREGAGTTNLFELTTGG